MLEASERTNGKCLSATGKTKTNFAGTGRGPRTPAVCVPLDANSVKNDFPMLMVYG